MKIGFIGTGNMANAIIKGIIKYNFVQAKEVLVFDVKKDTLNNLVESLGVTPCITNEDLVLKSDFIVLAVKPNQIKCVVSKLNFNGKTVISIAAATHIKEIQDMLINGDNVSIVRVMPNVNVAVGAGMTAICTNNNVKQNELSFVVNMFNAIGETIQLAEEYFSTFTAIAGSSPAFTYMYIDSLARAALKAGMTKDDATKIAAQAVLGSAKTLIETNDVPWALIDKVCSPGGTTIAGICTLEDNKFASTIVKGVDAVINADKEMINRKI